MGQGLFTKGQKFLEGENSSRLILGLEEDPTITAIGLAFYKASYW